MQKKSNGCFKNVVWLFLIVFMACFCLFVAPRFYPHKPAVSNQPAGPNIIQQIQKLLTNNGRHSTLPAPSGTCFDQARAAAVQNGIDSTLYARQINQESGCKSSICSPAGACGVAQLMPEMATSLGVDRFNVPQSLSAGAHLMAGYLKAHGGSWAVALACYNAGTGAVRYALSYGAAWLAHLPTETQNYIATILGN